MAECDSPTTTKEWAIQIDKKLRNMGPPRMKEELPKSIERQSMHRRPANVRKEPDDSDVYRPYRVSFGPYYHGDKSCRPREQNKEDSLLHFLWRSEKQSGYYLEAVRDMIPDLLGAYDDELDPVWQQDNNNAFLRMMLLDGCFLLELLRTGNDSRRPNYVSDNPTISRIQKNPSEMQCYMHDMLLLENQLPMILLQRLFFAERGDPHNVRNWDKFLDHITDKLYSTLRISTRHHTEFEYPLHILEVYRKSLVYQEFRRKKKCARRSGRRVEIHFNIPSATELHKVRIGFTTSESPIDISFRRKKTLRLPQIVVDDNTKSRFLNMIAFEQVHQDVGNEVSSYIYFMGCLIQGADDVSLLQIITALPSGEVARLFYRMSKDICIDTNDPLGQEYLEVGEMLRARFNKLSNEWRKDLFQTYLRSPWTIISVIAAALLFTLSLIQTVYTVLSYVHPK